MENCLYKGSLLIITLTLWPPCEVVLNPGKVIFLPLRLFNKLIREFATVISIYVYPIRDESSETAAETIYCLFPYIYQTLHV